MSQGGSGFGEIPPPPTTTPAVLVIVAVISILWSLGCGCFQAVGFTTVASIAALRSEDPAQLEKMVTDGLSQAELQQLASEPDETKREHIKAANDFMRRHSKELIAAMLRVSAELNRSGVGTLLGFLTLSNLPFLVGAVLMLGRRRIGRFLLLFTSAVMVMPRRRRRLEDERPHRKRPRRDGRIPEGDSRRTRRRHARRRGEVRSRTGTSRTDARSDRGESRLVLARRGVADAHAARGRASRRASTARAISDQPSSTASTASRAPIPSTAAAGRRTRRWRNT
jgi:hypothetical protein